MHKPAHKITAIFANAMRMPNHPLNWPYDHWYTQASTRRKIRWRLFHLLRRRGFKFDDNKEDLWRY